MESWINDFIKKAEHEINETLSKTIGVETVKEKIAIDNSKLHSSFKLPIEYVDKDSLHPLSSTVRDDLELVNKDEDSVYSKLFQPSNILGHNMIDDWKQQFTSDEQYLTDTQLVLKETKPIPSFFKRYEVDDNEFLDNWNELKIDHSVFLEKYGFIEWPMFESFNRSSLFLQLLSVINMMSPVISLMLPFIFLLFPFLILKLRGIPITMNTYITVLADIAKHHFIGKTLSNMKNISPTSLIYMVMGTCMFFYQIYQNIISCKRFYRNVQRLSRHLIIYKLYLGHTIENIDYFVSIHKDKHSYKQFCLDANEHSQVLKEIRFILQSHETPDFTVFDIGKIGLLLKNYYELHNNKKYEKSLRYSFGFEGFIDNIQGLQLHLSKKSINNILINNNEHSNFNEQYYPLQIENTKCVKNTCNLKKKMIITGPNASGKTTLLKTTTINIICAQQVGVGFFGENSNINPYTHIHSYLNIPDTSQRDSLFQAESRRCKDIIDTIHNSSKMSRHFGIFDELYSGTNPEEATKSGYAFLKYLSKYKNVDFILTTHYNKICVKLNKNENIQNYKMNVIENTDSKLVYTYKMKKGISKVQGAIKILEDMEYPEEIINDVKNFSKKSKDPVIEKVENSKTQIHDHKLYLS
tara:strand:- start:13787 stop:15697 length:1911 start_codon:yes stop_codon:yes gene_type:complete